MIEKKVELILHLQNGNAEEVKFVEIDGEKFQANPDKPEEALLDKDDNKIPFVEKKEAPKETEEEKKEREDKESALKLLGSMSMEDIAKNNPAISKMMTDGKSAQEIVTQLEKEKEDAKIKKAEDDGEWQKLANERADEIKNLKGDKTKQDEILSKYKGSIKSILKEVESTIPDDKKTLIPDGFSPRQRLEYITANAKFLGAKTIANLGDGKLKPNEEDPNATDEQKLAEEIDELNKKDNLTQAEQELMFEKSKKLKEIQASKKQ